MPKSHDTSIWQRIVEAFASIGIKGNPTAIAKELKMAQPSVRQWLLGETTPSRANVLAVAEITGFRAGYIEEGELPKKRGAVADPMTMELLAIWALLSRDNKLRVLERASMLLATQSPESAPRVLQRR